MNYLASSSDTPRCKVVVLNSCFPFNDFVELGLEGSVGETRQRQEVSLHNSRGGIKSLLNVRHQRKRLYILNNVGIRVDSVGSVDTRGI